MADKVAYPDTFPMGSVQTVVAALRKTGIVSTGDAIHAGWNVFGFAAGQIVPPNADPAPWPLGASPATMSSQELADTLEAAITPNHPAYCSSTPVAAQIDWKRIVIALLPILLDWLNDRK